MNALAQLVSDHPFIATAVGVVVAARIVTRDISLAKRFVEEMNSEKPASISATWNGVDRRGPNRATNVFRPAFGMTEVQATTDFIPETELVARKTGTHN